MVIATLICCCLREMAREEERERRRRTVVVVRDQRIDRAGLVQHEVMPDRSYPGGARAAGPYPGRQIPSRSMPPPYRPNQLPPPVGAQGMPPPYTVRQTQPPAGAGRPQHPMREPQNQTIRL